MTHLSNTNFPTPSRRKQYFEYIISICAILISLCAFGVSYYQTKVLKEQTQLMEEQKHAAVWPRLLLANNNSKNLFEIILTNNGVGPAIIQSVEICVDSIPMKSWKATFDYLKIKQVNLSVSHINKRTITPNKVITILHLTDTTMIQQLRDNYHRLSFQFKYSSIYNRNWKLERHSRLKHFPVPVEIDEIIIDEEREFCN